MGLLLHQNRPIRSRLAPTPSGYLHAGNAVNFAITTALVRAAGGHLHLRIDDLDAERVRSEYIEDIFQLLHWLDIHPDSGPQSAQEAEQYSQRKRIARYEEILGVLMRSGRVYACICSRSEISRRTGGLVYDGHCRNAGHPTASGVLRYHMETTAGDPVVRRRDGLPAYHIASLADDIDQGMNLIVRGEDLRESTAIQLQLAAALGPLGDAFRSAQFIHHGLLRRQDGEKLSKSKGDSPLTALRQRGEKLAFVFQSAAELLGVPAADNLAELILSVRQAPATFGAVRDF